MTPTTATFRPEPDLDAFREEVRGFIEKHFDPVIPTQGPFPQADTPEKAAFIKKLAAQGWLGLDWPIEYGGKGLDETYQIVLQEELDYVGHPSLSIEVGMMGATLMRNGSPELKRDILPRIVSGDLSIALGYSEPEAGSDLANLQLRAVRDGDNFILNGEKMYTSGAHFAQMIWLAARTDPDVSKHQGISLFLVDTKAPGIEVSRIDTMADHQTNMVHFNDAVVPASRLVGEVDQGWRHIMEALDYERLKGFPFGGLQRDLDELIAWGREESRWDDPRVRRLIARCAVNVEGARTHSTRSFDRVLRHEVPTIEATMLKVALTETRQNNTEAIVDLLGVEGLLREDVADAPMSGRFELRWRSGIIDTIAGGANEIQRNILAERHLGLPRGS
ncbi:MAG: acyl-CoA dehydrogenase family protein [Woeseiaceae bacterium]